MVHMFPAGFAFDFYEQYLVFVSSSHIASFY